MPPSAWSTSQSIQTVRSPRASRFTEALKDRPMSRWISWPRPLGRPLEMSRGVLWWVDRGSMAYSALTHPLPLPRRKGGTFSSTEAVQSTWVCPHRIQADPSA